MQGTQDNLIFSRGIEELTLPPKGIAPLLHQKASGH